MTLERCSHLVAVDIGNSALKVGRFRASPDPSPLTGSIELQLEGVSPTVMSAKDMRAAGSSDLPPKPLEALLLQLPAEPQRWYVASVNRAHQTRLSCWINCWRPQDEYELLDYRDFALRTDVRCPERVGADRLAAAAAVNELRAPERPAIIVDAGTAITVDVVTSDGVFRGGAILPGMETAAMALNSATDALPLVEPGELSSPPPPIGKATEEAIRSGIVWGCVGAVRELIVRVTGELAAEPEVFCTGGTGLHLARLIGREWHFDPNLVLRGIALAGFRHLWAPQDTMRE